MHERFLHLFEAYGLDQVDHGVAIHDRRLPVHPDEFFWSDIFNNSILLIMRFLTRERKASKPWFDAEVRTQEVWQTYLWAVEIQKKKAFATLFF